ncbi:MAG TPA: tricarballylate utilization 4Fe-4S protein TcuB [Candidatus Limnocylindria bacterium]|nr:tricarballylate utilization 4Fe-4S protein TcuB [Candidatus Limnocylindria bacterium]
MPLADLVREADRQLTICNACRYCEEYCAVFPALERRTTFGEGDVAYIANLCHDCRACYYACMYAPPHEFAVNLPLMLSAVRVATYDAYAWPSLLSRLLGNGVRSTVAATVVGTCAVLGLVFAFGEPSRMLVAQTGPGSFYRVLPYLAMAVPFLVLTAYVLAIMIGSGLRFWRKTGARLGDLVDGRSVIEATRDALDLRYLRGGEADGCYYPTDEASHSRRWLHAAVFYGFMSAFAATTIAAFMQEFLGLMPPYPLYSPPVVLGSAGGVAMIVGSGGLMWLKWRSDVRPAAHRMLSRDYGFLVALNFVSTTGMLVLGLRATPAMGTVLIVHLGAIAALFLMMPYGKFVHFMYRYAALVQDKIERRRDGSSEPAASAREALGSPLT